MFAFIVAGLISGIALGAIGIGGGALLIPMLLPLGMTMPQAIGITLVTQVLPQTLPGLIMYWKAGNVPIRESVAVVIGSMFGVIIGAYVVTRGLVPKIVLLRITATTLVVIGLYMWYKYCR
jgi:uncharacterized membrane protein YfcA